ENGAIDAGDCGTSIGYVHAGHGARRNRTASNRPHEAAVLAKECCPVECSLANAILDRAADRHGFRRRSLKDLHHAGKPLLRWHAMILGDYDVFSAGPVEGERA